MEPTSQISKESSTSLPAEPSRSAAQVSPAQAKTQQMANFLIQDHEKTASKPTSPALTQAAFEIVAKRASNVSDMTHNIKLELVAASVLNPSIQDDKIKLSLACEALWHQCFLNAPEEDRARQEASMKALDLLLDGFTPEEVKALITQLGPNPIHATNNPEFPYCFNDNVTAFLPQAVITDRTFSNYTHFNTLLLPGEPISELGRNALIRLLDFFYSPSRVSIANKLVFRNDINALNLLMNTIGLVNIKKELIYNGDFIDNKELAKQLAIGHITSSLITGIRSYNQEILNLFIKDCLKYAKSIDDKEVFTAALFDTISRIIERTPENDSIEELGRLSMMKSLIDADRSVIDFQGQWIGGVCNNKMTLLMLAARQGDTGAVRLLLAEDAEARLKDSRGQTALEYCNALARKQGELKSTSIIRKLLEDAMRSKDQLKAVELQIPQVTIHVDQGDTTEAPNSGNT